MLLTRNNDFFVRRQSTENCFYQKKDYINELHKALNNNLLFTKTSIKIVDSHEAYPYYDSDTDTIILDTHYFDILRIVTAVMISGKTEYMETVADLCTAEYFLCKDEICLSLKYANLFEQKKEDLIAILNTTKKETDRLFYKQLIFILSHEQGHGLLSQSNEDNGFDFFRESFNAEFERILSETKDILSVDISPIINDLEMLEKYFVENSFSYSFEDISKFEKFTHHLFDIINKGEKLINTPNSSSLSKELMIYYAIHMYLTNSKYKLLERKNYENECIVDGFALQRLANFSFKNENILTQMQDVATVYFSCILTMNIIICVNACVMNANLEAYRAEDLVWNRLRLEREIFNSVMKQCAFSKPNGIYIAESFFNYSNTLLKDYNKLYARFCDKAFSIEQPSDETPHVSCVSKEFSQMYDMICKLISL